MVEKQVMEDVKKPPVDPLQALGILGGTAVALPVGYFLGRGALAATQAGGKWLAKQRQPGGFLAPKQPSSLPPSETLDLTAGQIEEANMYHKYNASAFENLTHPL